MTSRRSAFAGLALAALAFGAPVQAQVACLPIDRIQTTGVTLLPKGELRKALAPFEGGCLGLDGINGALEAITIAYVEQGYVTARAYLPEQDISDRVLDIAVVEGRLEAIRFNGSQNRRWQQIVFPGLVGKPVQLRDVEQGLDVIRSMPAYDAKMDISAGTSEGQSVLDVEATAKHPWTIRIGANNYGSRLDSGDPTNLSTLATYSGTVDLTWDHLFGLNETWSVGYSRGTETYPFDTDDGDYATRRLEFGLRLPYGPWTFEAKHTRSDYALSSFGTISFIPSDGWVHETRLKLSRLLGRGRDSKTTLSGTLEWRENEDRVSGIVIDASSRKLSSFRLELQHERLFRKGTLNARVGVEKGLKLFGAEVLEEVSPTQPEAQFTLIDASIGYSRPWQTKAGNFSYRGSISGQYAFDPLHGNYQFNLGGVSTVRGSSRALMSGASGVLWRNEISFAPARQNRWPGNWQFYAALDAGHIFKKYSTTTSNAGGGPAQLIGGAMAGGAIGLRGRIGAASLDVGWHQVLSVPGGLIKPKGELLVSLSVRF